MHSTEEAYLPTKYTITRYAAASSRNGPLQKPVTVPLTFHIATTSVYTTTL